MNPNYALVSKIMKILATIMGIVLIVLGTILGIAGLDPGGHVYIEGRTIGLIVLYEGILYLIPNSMIHQPRGIALFYYISTLIPCLLFLLWALIDITKSGMESFIKFGGFYIMIMVFLVSILAPSSLFFYQKSVSAVDGLDKR